MVEYMASCGGDDCSKFDASKAKWFKISQVGRKNGGKGDWAQADLSSCPSTSPFHRAY